MLAVCFYVPEGSYWRGEGRQLSLFYPRFWPTPSDPPDILKFIEEEEEKRSKFGKTCVIEKM